MFILKYSTSAPIPKNPQLFIKDTLPIMYLPYCPLPSAIIHFGYASSYSDIHIGTSFLRLTQQLFL